MPRSTQLDPLDRFRWRIYIVSPVGAGFTRAGFTECSAPEINLVFKEHIEGGRHLNPRLIQDGASFGTITLRRGVIEKGGTDDFARWVEDAVKPFNPDDGFSSSPNYRNDIVIDHLNRDSQVVKRYILRNCVPVNYKVADDFAASDDSGISMETLSFKYEGFEEDRPDQPILNTLRRFRGIF